MYQVDVEKNGTLTIPLAESQQLMVTLTRGKPLFVVGPNGSGKSALLHRCFNSFPRDRLVYIPGSRANYFPSESRSLTPNGAAQMRSTFDNYNAQPLGRWSFAQSPNYNEVPLYDLQTLENDYKMSAAEDIASKGHESQAIAILQQRESPLDKLNAILAQANLQVRLRTMRSEIMAERSGASYSVAKMSEGERAAILLAAQVMCAPHDSIFVIDEPEPHLHDTIIVPLVIALVRARSDSEFIIGTHKLEVISSMPSSVLLVRGSVWSGDQVVSWDADYLEDPTKIPEESVSAIVGSRRKILFVEGTSASLDQPLYALLFPQVSVLSRQGCEQVQRSVRSLRESSDYHRIESFGMIDNDGLAPEVIAKYQSDHIYPLPVYNVESIYYSKLVRDAICIRQAEFLGLDPETIIMDVEAAGLAELEKSGVQEFLAACKSYMQLHNAITNEIPRRETLSALGSSVSITVNSPYDTSLQELRTLISAESLNEVIAHFPVSKSPVFGSMVKAMRMNRESYELAVLRLLGTDNVLRQQIVTMLEPLSAKLV